MASGSSSSQGSRAPAGAPPAADDAHLLPPQPSLNPKLAMPSTELERRPASAEALVRAGDKRVDRLLEGNSARDAQIHQAAVTEAEISALQQPRAKARARHGSANSGRGGLTQQVGVVPRKRPYKSLRMSAPLGFPTDAADESLGSDTSIDTTSDDGEVGDDVPRQYVSLRMNASPRFGGRRSALQARRRR